MTREQDQMVRAMAGTMSGPEQENFVQAVTVRLAKLAEQGVEITRNHVRSAATAELAK